MTPGISKGHLEDQEVRSKGTEAGTDHPLAHLSWWVGALWCVGCVCQKEEAPNQLSLCQCPFFQGVVAWEVSLFFTEENSLVGTCRRHNIDNYCRVGLSFQAVDLDPLPGEHPGYMLGMSFWNQERRDIQEGGPAIPQSCQKGVLGQSSQGRLAGSHRSKNYTFTDLPQFSSQVTPNLCTAR